MRDQLDKAALEINHQNMASVDLTAKQKEVDNLNQIKLFKEKQSLEINKQNEFNRMSLKLTKLSKGLNDLLKMMNSQCPIEGDIIRIKSINSGKQLSCQDGSNCSGTNIIQDSFIEKSHQKFCLRQERGYSRA